jgi:Flp pilus assembly protein TadD
MALLTFSLPGRIALAGVLRKMYKIINWLRSTSGPGAGPGTVAPPLGGECLMAAMTRRWGLESATASFGIESGRNGRSAFRASVLVGLLLAGCTEGPALQPGTNASLQAAQLKAAQQAEATYNYSDAVGIYQGLHAQNPDNADLTLSLARNLRFAGQPQNAIAVISQLIGKQGRTPTLLTELGKAYLAADQDNLALPTLLEAKEKAPNDWEILSTIGVAYDYQGNYADAREAYAQALIASPSNPTVLNNLALSQASSGDLDGAIATLQQAIDQPTASAQTRQNLALMMALKGNPDAAERLARKDLPPDVADNNNAYFRMISAAAKGANPSASQAPAGESGATAVQ